MAEKTKKTTEEVITPEETKEESKTAEILKKYAATKPTEVKQYMLSKELDEQIAKITKNIGYCKENACEDALKEGGKFFKAFENLVKITIEMEKDKIRQDLIGLIPVKSENKGKEAKMVNDLIEASYKGLYEVTRSGDIDKIGEFFKSMYLRYVNAFVKEIVQ